MSEQSLGLVAAAADREQPAEAVEFVGNVAMKVGSIQPAVEGQGLAQEILGLGVLAADLKHPRQIVETAGNLGMLVTEELAADRQCLAMHLFRQPVFPAVGFLHRQVIAVLRHLEVMRTVELATQRQRLCEQRLGAIVNPQAAVDLADDVQQLGAHLRLTVELLFDLSRPPVEELAGRHLSCSAAAQGLGRIR